MDIQDAKKYLQMLGQELQKKQITGEILIADDIIMLLDIKKPEESDRDAYMAYLRGENPTFERHEGIHDYFGGHETIIGQAITYIGTREGLAENWLDAALKAIFSSSLSHQKWLEYLGLRIYLAPVDYMLAMKVATSYPQDTEDVKILAEKLHISNAQEMLAVITRYIPEQLLTPEMHVLVEQSFASESKN